MTQQNATAALARIADLNKEITALQQVLGDPLHAAAIKEAAQIRLAAAEAEVAQLQQQEADLKAKAAEEAKAKEEEQARAAIKEAVTALVAGLRKAKDCPTFTEEPTEIGFRYGWDRVQGVLLNFGHGVTICPEVDEERRKVGYYRSEFVGYKVNFKVHRTGESKGNLKVPATILKLVKEYLAYAVRQEEVEGAAKKLEANGPAIIRAAMPDCAVEVAHEYDRTYHTDRPVFWAVYPNGAKVRVGVTSGGSLQLHEIKLPYRTNLSQLNDILTTLPVDPA